MLDQYDYIAQGERSQMEDWTEYIWSWGAGLKFARFNLNYTGRMINGSGIPSVQSFWFNGGGFFDDRVVAMEMSADIIAAPSGQLEIDFQTTITHQFTIHIPLNFKDLR